MEKRTCQAAADPAGYTRPQDEELRQRLTPQQYNVTHEDGTEPAFNNEYWDNNEAGLYADRRRLRRTAFQLPRQVRLGHRLAELHPAPGA